MGAFAWYLNIDTKPNAILDIKVPELMIFSIVVVAALLVFVVKYPKYSANQLFSTIFGIFYIPVMISFIFKTRETIAFGQWLAWMVYVSSWGSDTCAYAVGRLFGKHKLVIGGLGSIISQIGDLAASGIKRNYDIKDYGHLIPGHGGILDRYDSIIITAPIVYFLSLYLVGRI